MLTPPRSASGLPRRPLMLLALLAVTAGLWLALPSAPATGQSARKTHPLVGQQAPLWQVPTWGNLPPDTNAPEVTDFEGKTIYLYCFQSWCPGCHSSGFPTLKKVREHYADNDNVVFLAVQTVFEGFDTNHHERGVQIVTEKFGLDIPVGHSGSPDRPSKLMRSYRTGGTPWTLIIGPDRVLHYGDFHIDAGEAIKLIDGLQP